MIRTAVHALVCLLLLAGRMEAQEWAEKMFERTTYDFGTIARGAKSVFRFQVKNIYEETVHITGVRSSCGCTASRVVTPTLGTFETGEIEAEFNTVAFRGQHSATLTVMIDQPYPAEVQLHVHGNVRSDVVFNPGSIKFGTVDAGAKHSERVAVRYAGRKDWRIADVRSENSNFEVEVNETERTGGRVTYELLVELKESFPIGYINEQLILVTNDRRNTRIPLHVEGRVVPEITVTPRSLVLGTVSVGETATKKLVVSSSSKRPFRIVAVDCDDECFSFDHVKKSDSLYLIAVAFEPRDITGKMQETIRIRTDRSGQDVTLVAHATVIHAEPD